jgi:replicative DNA helicase
MKVEEIIQRLENEIVKTQDGLIQEQSLQRLKEIALVYNGEDKVVSFAEIAERLKTRGEELKIMSGWAKLDEIVCGFRLQQLVVVSAFTKHGKTSLLIDLTTKIKNTHPLWFAFEESAEELIQKYLDRGEDPPHAYTSEYAKKSTLEWIESKIVESIAKYGTQVVFIDQLDFIIPYSSDNRADRIGDAMRTLKGIAKRWHVVIFLICHLSKARMNEQPTLDELKGSSSIGQEADTVILLWREQKKENGQVIISNNVNVSVQANRRTGKTGNVKMVYNNGHFLEQEWKQEEPQYGITDETRKAFRKLK